MNVELARKVQSSIADKSKLYSKGRWECCIAAHTIAVAKGLPLPLDVVSYSVPDEARLLLGLTNESMS